MILLLIHYGVRMKPEVSVKMCNSLHRMSYQNQNLRKPKTIVTDIAGRLKAKFKSYFWQRQWLAEIHPSTVPERIIFENRPLRRRIWGLPRPLRHLR